MTAATVASRTGDPVPLAASAALIGVDWGTTHARAFLIGGDGEVLATRASAQGLTRLAGRSFEAALDDLLGDWRDASLPRIACGMVGSRNGWIEVPYVALPATLDELARGIGRTPGGELAIVPGVQGRDASGAPDVMRGEETELFGTDDADAPRTLFVLPGTHAKWVDARDGRIEGFATFMTGEIYAVMLEHSILGRLAARDGNADVDGAAFVRGVASGLGDGALAHDLFTARTLVLAGEMAGADVAGFLSGLLIGREVRDGTRWAASRGIGVASAVVVGADALAARYMTALGHAGIAARRAPAAAPRGLWRIARAAALV
jgi:2-dehydro-3-deoxygalactonokinase